MRLFHVHTSITCAVPMCRLCRD